MRKNLILTVFVIAMMAAMTGCSKEPIPREISEHITIDAGVGSLTRATATDFEKNDRVSIYAWTGSNSTVQTPLVVNNSVNTYDGTKWTASPQMLWADMVSAHYFIGISPVKSVADFTADTYTFTPDLLVATVLGAGRVAQSGIVPLTFDHVMAKLAVNLTFRDQFGGTPTVESVTVKAQPGAVVNYLTKTATGRDTATDVAMAAVTANSAYSQIISPQHINTITITIDGDKYTYNNTAGFALLAGKIQTINLIVGRDQITLGSVSINDWTSGETIDDGEAEDESK